MSNQFDAGQQSATFDLSGVGGLGFEVIPAGKYVAEITETTYAPSKAGNPMLTVIFELDDEEDAEDGKGQGGRKIWEFCVFSGGGAEFGVKKVKALLVAAFPEVDLAAFNPETFADSGEALGVKVGLELTVYKDKDTKELKNRIKAFYPADPSSGGLW